MAFHVRVTLTRDDSVKVCKQIVEHFKPIRYICGYEEVGDNKHMHMHIETSKEQRDYLISGAGKNYKSTFFKKIGYSGKYYFQECEDPKGNELYVAKDLDIVDHNYEEEDYDLIINETKKINENKKLEQRDKLLEAFKQEYKDIPKQIKSNDNALDDLLFIDNPDYPHELWQIAQWIHWQYINIYNKPPPIVHMKEYVLWIASKMELMDTESYYRKMF